MKRPVGVTIFAMLLMVAAILSVTLATITAWDKGFRHGIPGEPAWIGVIPVVARIALGLIYGLIGRGLWNLRRWARGVLLLYTISGVIVAVAMLIISRIVPQMALWTPPLWGWILFAGYPGLVVYYFMKREIKHAFGIQ